MAAQDAIMLVFVEYLLRVHVSGVITIEVEFFPIHWDSIGIIYMQSCKLSDYIRQTAVFT